MANAFCELNEAGDKIEVYFPFNAERKDKVKAIKGARFVGKDKNPPNGPHWTVPLDIVAARKLREIFGDDLQLGRAVRSWGRQEAQLERNLKGLAIADDAELKRVPKVAPIIDRIIAGDPIPELKLHKKNPLSRQRKPRPYQRADISMMAQANVINANQPGTGKTLEWLGAVVEAGLERGPHLVCAPRASLVNTWQVEIERLLGHKVFTSENPRERRRQVEHALTLAEQGLPVWVLVIFDDIRVKRILKKNDETTPEQIEASEKDPLYARKDHKGNVYAFNSDTHARITAQHWNTFNIDEFHKSGLNTPDSLFTLGADLIRAERVCPMSGTPMGGKPIKLFPVLRRIDPKTFSSKWRWADEWLEVDSNGFGKRIGGIQKGKEDEFYDYHARYMVRRLKREALPGLPPKVIEVVMCPMTSKQRKQYEKFDRDAEIAIEAAEGSRTVVGDCVLAEFTRLRQFANAYCVINDRDEVVPTEESGKLPFLLDKLDEFGIRRHDPEPGARAIVASQSKRMVDMVVLWLRSQGIACDALTGDTKDSAPIINKFKDMDNEDPYVIVMTTQTGGVSLNLGEANSIHILDESWNPDDDEQLEDRGDRGERDTPLVCVYYRTEGTIQEYVAEVAEGKKLTNANVLDVYRQIKKEQGREEVAAA